MWPQAKQQELNNQFGDPRNTGNMFGHPNHLQSSANNSIYPSSKKYLGQRLDSFDRSQHQRADITQKSRQVSNRISKHKRSRSKEAIQSQWMNRNKRTHTSSSKLTVPFTNSVEETYYNFNGELGVRHTSSGNKFSPYKSPGKENSMNDSNFFCYKKL